MDLEIKEIISHKDRKMVKVNATISSRGDNNSKGKKLFLKLKANN